MSRNLLKEEGSRPQNLLAFSVTQSCLTLWPHEPWPTKLLCSWDSPGKNTRVGCHSLLQGIFPTQGSRLRLLHCRQILYHLSHQGILAYWLGSKLKTKKKFHIKREFNLNTGIVLLSGFPGVSTVICRRPQFNPWVRKIPWRREWLPTPVFLPGESHEQRSLAGYSP